MIFQRLFTITGDAEARRQGRTVITIALFQLGLLATALPLVLLVEADLGAILSIGFSSVCFIAIIALARAGRVGLAAGGLIVVSIIGAILANLPTPGPTPALFYLLLPIIIAGMLARPPLVWLTLSACLTTFAIKTVSATEILAAADLQRQLLFNVGLLLIFMGVLAVLNASLMRQAFHEMQTAQAQTEQGARHLEEVNASLEECVALQTAELRAALAAAQAHATAQEQLLAENAAQRLAIRELGVPVLPVSHDTLVLPLVGALDTERLEEVQTMALDAVERTRARTLLVDITGVPVVDTHVARGLIGIIQASRLLGAEPMLIGVRPEVAQAIISLGIDLGSVRTSANLESALRAR